MSVAVGLSVMVLLVILHVAKERERDVVAIVSAAMDFVGGRGIEVCVTDY